VITRVRRRGAALEKVVFAKKAWHRRQRRQGAGSNGTCAAEQTRDWCPPGGAVKMAWLDSPISRGRAGRAGSRRAIRWVERRTCSRRHGRIWDACSTRQPDGAEWGGRPEDAQQVRFQRPSGSRGGLRVRGACGIDRRQRFHRLAGGRADSKSLQEMFPKMVPDFFHYRTIGPDASRTWNSSDLARHVGAATLPITAA